MDGANCFVPLRMTSTESYAATFPTQLEYRTNSDADSSVIPPPKASSPWWNPILFSSAAKSSTKDKSRAVDDYLEFLERRYHRLHDEEQEQNRPSTGVTKFSALRWLTQGAEAGTAEAQRQQQDDALYALGVAGLASRQLLTKHRPHAPAESRPVVDEASATRAAMIGGSATRTGEASLPASPAIFSNALDRLHPLARHVLVRRKLLLRYQSRQLNVLAALVAKAVATGPAKAASALFRMGGGKKNIAVTLTVMAAFSVFVLRPLTEFLLAVQSA